MKRIFETVASKAAKQYPHDTALIVRIDDCSPFREDADVAALDELVRYKLVPMLSGREFRVLALEGSRAVHLPYDL